MADFSAMSLAELKEEAKKRGLRGFSSMKKQELAEALSAQQTNETETVKKETMPAKESKKAVKETRAAKKVVEETKPEQPAAKEEAVEAAVVETPEAGKEEPVSDEADGAGREEQPADVRSIPEERRVPLQGAPERRPLYQDRGQAGMQRRPGSYVQQPRAGYNAQPGYNNAGQSRPQQNTGDQPPQPKGPTAMDIAAMSPKELEALDSGETKTGILEIMPEGFGFIRCDNYLPGENDVYVGTPLLRKYGLRTGDIVSGNTKIRTATEKFSPLLYVKTINGFPVVETPMRRPKFEHLTPVFPNQRIHLETPNGPLAMRMVDLISPIGKGQRGMIVSQPKTGKTTLLKQVAKAITRNHKDMHLIILLIDERPEEVTDIKESIEGEKVEVIYSTFDELPENHKRVSEMVIERAKRLVEHKKDVVILLDSITRLARAYNLTVQASGRTLSGGLDPAALHMPKKFFGAARNMREGGSLTILSTALVETGSRMDDVVFEEFKGTGNMELVLNRSLSERRVFPAIDLPKSSTRREDLLLTPTELEATTIMRRALNGMKSEEATENIIKLFTQTRTNAEFIEMVKKTKIIN
ncbi:MAG: transcription termination factor Rho [Lachnospiraceae bacterium]|nr:transcription termination factor Rho [Lachnospiraceae bacterium]